MAVYIYYYTYVYIQICMHKSLFNIFTCRNEAEKLSIYTICMYNIYVWINVCMFL